MEIDVRWLQPIPLIDGSKELLIYTCESPDDLPEGPGVYIFGRQHGDTFSPLYIGQATDLRQRILLQQFNNAKLMNGIKQAEAGSRMLLIGEVDLRGGQRVKRVLDVVESALIEYALANGHELLNKQGTRTPVHVINFTGNRTSRQVAPLRLQARA